MSNRDKKWLEYALLVVAILVAGYFGVRYPLPEMPEYVYVEGIEMQAVGPTRFRTILVDHEATIAGALTASGGVVGDVTGDVTGNVTGDLTGDVTGDVVGDLTNSTFLNLTAQTAVSVTAGGIITATGTYQPLTSAAAVTTSTSCAVYSGTVKGQLLVLTNENASDAIIIDDGANTNLGGNKTLTGGEGDALYLMWDETDWFCVGYNDN